MGTFNGLGQGFGVPNGEGLAGVEDEPDALVTKPLREIDHVVQVAGADDGDRIGLIDGLGGKGGGVFHGAGVEGGDLVVGHVGDDVGAGGGFFLDDVDGTAVDALVV